MFALPLRMGTRCMQLALFWWVSLLYVWHWWQQLRDFVILHFNCQAINRVILIRQIVIFTRPQQTTNQPTQNNTRTKYVSKNNNNNNLVNTTNFNKKNVYETQSSVATIMSYTPQKKGAVSKADNLIHQMLRIQPYAIDNCVLCYL